MKKLFLILAMLLAFAGMAYADCWVGGDYTLDPLAESAEVIMYPDNVSIGALPIPAAVTVLNITGISSLSEKTFSIRQSFLGGAITNESTPMVASSVVPASILHLLGGCE